MSSFKREKFKPTPHMLVFAEERAKDALCSDRKITRKMKMSQARVSDWKKKPGFNEWFEDHVAYLRKPMHDRLEAVANYRAIFDFNFFKVLAEKYGYIEKEQSKYMMLKDFPSKDEITQLIAKAIERDDPKTGA